MVKRYHYNQTRLSRLNLLIRFVPSLLSNARSSIRYYFAMHWYTVTYLKQFGGPGLFIFASVSLLLSATEVILSVPREPLMEYLE